MNNSYADQNFFPIQIMINYMAKFEHLDETCQEAIEHIGTRQWNMTLWVQQNHKIKTFLMGDTFFWFSKR